MSRGRWDRNRAARTQRWETDYFRLTGGLDENASALAVKPGRLAQCLNFEEVFGKQGYSFVRGYERYDGRLRPSQAHYAVLEFNTGTAAIAAGDTVTNATTAIGLVASVTLTSGSWVGGDAAGYLWITDVTNSWSTAQPIRVGGVTKATAAASEFTGSYGYALHETALRTVREFLRARIQAVPGSGPIRGGAVFFGRVYVVRDDADGLAATMWKSSSSGWTAVESGIHAGGPYRFEIANFTGDPENLGLYCVNGRGRMFQILEDDTLAYMAIHVDSTATSGSSVTIGTGAKTFTVVESARSWQNGDSLTIWRVSGADDSMTGTVTAYNSGTGQLDMNITSVTGSGTHTSWEIGRSDFRDKPFDLKAHQNHMFLAYPRGQLQTSSLGDPLTVDGTAQLFGIGQEIQSLKSLKGKLLGVFCTDKIDVIDGSSATNWVQDAYSNTTGAAAETVQDNDGNAIFLNRKGLTSLQATQSFGDFEASLFSRDVNSTLEASRENVVGSRMARNNYQYRLYLEDGYNLRFTFLTGASTIQPRDVSPTLAKYLHTPSCLFSGTMTNEDDQERMFFGTDDGYVMEEDMGTSYDGTAIFYGLRLPFNHMKSAAVDKQGHKLEIELDCPDPITIYMRQLFDYGDGTFRHGGLSFDLEGQGGRWDLENWEEFFWDRPTLSRLESSIDGQFRNMGLMLWAESDLARPASLQGVMTFFTPLAVRP